MRPRGIALSPLRHPPRRPRRHRVAQRRLRVSTCLAMMLWQARDPPRPVAAEPQPKKSCESASLTAQWKGLSEDLTFAPEERDALFSTQICGCRPWCAVRLGPRFLAWHLARRGLHQGVAELFVGQPHPLQGLRRLQPAGDRPTARRLLAPGTAI